MTQVEFYEWLDYHKSKFTGIAQWLHRMPSLGLNRDDVMTSWYRTLSRCTLDDAKAATDKLGSDEEPEPKGWDRHPLAIAGICHGRRKAYGPKAAYGPRLHPDGTETFQCRLCHDWGVVTIYHPQTVDAIRQGCEVQKGKVLTAAARCVCNGTYHLDLHQYNVRRDLLAPVDYSTSENIARLIDWCSIERRMENAEWAP